MTQAVEIAVSSRVAQARALLEMVVPSTSKGGAKSAAATDAQA
jgi:hypothetical protein